MTVSGEPVAAFGWPFFACCADPAPVHKNTRAKLATTTVARFITICSFAGDPGVDPRHLTSNGPGLPYKTSVSLPFERTDPELASDSVVCPPRAGVPAARA